MGSRTAVIVRARAAISMRVIYSIRLVFSRGRNVISHLPLVLCSPTELQKMRLSWHVSWSSFLLFKHLNVSFVRLGSCYDIFFVVHPIDRLSSCNAILLYLARLLSPFLVSPCVVLSNTTSQAPETIGVAIEVNKMHICGVLAYLAATIIGIMKQVMALWIFNQSSDNDKNRLVTLEKNWWNLSAIVRFGIYTQFLPHSPLFSPKYMAFISHS